MHRCSFLFLLLSASPLCVAQSLPLRHPESVTSDGTYLYISNLGNELTPSAKDGDGFIARASLTGTLEPRPFATGLHAPKGMAIVKNTLYVTDIDRVIGFDLTTRKPVFTLDFGATKTVLLNDLTVKDARTLLVSATDLNKIFQIHLDKQPTYEALALPPLSGPNGLWYDATSRRLYVVGLGTNNRPTGEIGVIQWTNGRPKYRKLSPKTGLYDGLALLNDHELLVSDWVEFTPKGQLKLLNLRTHQWRTIAGSLAGPADFYWDAKRRTVRLPLLLSNQLRTHTL